MRRHVLALVALLGFVLSVFGDADIPTGCRVPNRNPGYCMWACIEMLGRHQHDPRLFDLVESRSHDKDEFEEEEHDGVRWLIFRTKNLGTAVAVRNKMKALGIKGYRLQDSGKDTSIITDALRVGHGVVVVMKWPNPPPKTGMGFHAIILTHMDDNRVHFIDPNDHEANWGGPRAWFDTNWVGVAFSLN